MISVSATQLTRYFFEDHFDEEEDELDVYESDCENCDCEDESDVFIKPGKQEIGTSLKRSSLLSINSNECSICLTEFDPEEIDHEDCLMAIQQCNHKFCKDCLSEYVNFKTSDIHCLYHQITSITFENSRKITIRETTMYGVPCPAIKCKHIMNVKEFKPVVSNTILERFDKFTRVHMENLELIRNETEAREQRRLQEIRDRDARKPKCSGCNQTNFNLRRRGRVECSNCHKPACGICFRKHRLSISCEQHAQQLADIEAARVAAEQARRSELEAQARVRQASSTRGSGWCDRIVSCPKCSYKICRSDGCNCMTCRCGCRFCYLCGDTTDGKHFPFGPFGNRCSTLFTNGGGPVSIKIK